MSVTTLLSLLVLLVGAEPGAAVALDDPDRCIDAADLDARIAASVPSDWDAAHRGALSVAVTIRGATVGLIATAPGDDEPLVERLTSFVRSDCPQLPRLLGVILARALAELPRERWPTRTMPPLAPAESVGWQTRLSLMAGFEAGLDTGAWAGRLAAAAGLGPPDGPHLILSLLGAATAPLTVGDGDAQLTTVLLGVGGGWDLKFKGWRLTPRVVISAGFAVSTGLYFDDAVTEIVPASRASAGLSVGFDFGLLVAADVDASLLRVRLSQRDSAASRLEPGVRVVFSAGWRFSL